MSKRRRLSDSHPMNFSRQDIQAAAVERDRWLDFNRPLDFISVDLVRRAQNDAVRGAYAQIQWLWEQLEPADSILATCVERRLGALVRIPWSIDKKPGLNDAEDVIAEAQMRTLTDFANALENLDEGIMALAQASFRHFRRIQLLETETGALRLNVTNNWNWVRDGYNGEWLWNPAATLGLSRGERLPVDPASIITRICPRPIDQPAMMLCLDRKNSKAQWLTFNGRYGTPPLFAIMPTGLSEDVKASYIEFARQCVSNAAGVLPAGSDVKAVTPGTTGPQTFKEMIDLSTQELVLRATGGLMTMLTAPGAGTNTATGSAHQDAFDDLAEREAEEIAACLNAALFDPLLDQWHPGQPHLVEFVMRRPDSANASGAVANLAALAAAGYRVPVEKVAELVGYEVTDAAGGTSAGGMQPPGTAFAANMQRVERRWQPLMKYAPARAAFAEAIKRKVDAARAAEAAEEERKKPLTERELEALERVGKLRVADLMRADAATLEQGMTVAVERVKGKPAVSLNQCNQHAHDEGCDGGSSSSPSSDTSPKPEADDGKKEQDEPAAESKAPDTAKGQNKSAAESEKPQEDSGKKRKPFFPDDPIKAIDDVVNDVIAKRNTKNDAVIIQAVPNEKLQAFGITNKSDKAYAIALLPDQVSHAIARHGNEKKAWKRVTPTDFRLVPSIILEHDNVAPSAEKGRNGEDRYLVEKHIGNVTYTNVVEHKKGKKQLAFITMHKNKRQK